MPEYDYACAKCRKRFSIQQHIREHNERGKPKCPQCGSREVDRLISAVHVQTSRKT